MIPYLQSKTVSAVASVIGIALLVRKEQTNSQSDQMARLFFNNWPLRP